MQRTSPALSRNGFSPCTKCKSTFNKVFARSEVLLAENALLRSRINELSKLANTDTLTGLPNRLALVQHAENAIAHARTHHSKLGLVVIDIDNFKTINDTYGHLAGDAVLSAFAERLRKSCRVSDFIARFGGEEFVMILSNTKREDVCQMIETLRRRTQQKLRVSVNEHIISITASFGIAMLEDSSDTADTLFKRADEALYVAKGSGRNQVVTATRSTSVPTKR